jgi:hypothetical protein
MGWKMIEYGKYTLNLRKTKIRDMELEEKLNNIFLILYFLSVFTLIINIKYISDNDIWINILWTLLIVVIPWVKTALEKKSLFLKGEIDLEIKRDNFYFYKDEIKRLELFYVYTDIKYRKTIFNDIKLILTENEKVFTFYIKKDSNISGYEKLYSDLEKTEYHVKISLVKELVFIIVMPLIILVLIWMYR